MWEPILLLAGLAWSPSCTWSISNILSTAFLTTSIPSPSNVLSFWYFSQPEERFWRVRGASSGGTLRTDVWALLLHSLGEQCGWHLSVCYITSAGGGDTLVSLQGKGRVRRGAYPSPASPVTGRLPSVTDVPEETMSSEEAMEMEVTEQQQVAMQQEEKVLTEQIESLQKEK